MNVILMRKTIVRDFLLIEFDKESHSLRVLDPISHAKNNK